MKWHNDIYRVSEALEVSPIVTLASSISGSAREWGLSKTSRNLLLDNSQAVPKLYTFLDGHLGGQGTVVVLEMTAKTTDKKVP